MSPHDFWNFVLWQRCVFFWHHVVDLASSHGDGGGGEDGVM